MELGPDPAGHSAFQAPPGTRLRPAVGAKSYGGRAADGLRASQMSRKRQEPWTTRGNRDM